MIKKFADQGIGCTLLKPRPLEVDWEVPSGTCTTYTKRIREYRPRYDKSCDDMRLIKDDPIEEEPELDEFGNPIEKVKAIACEVGESLPGFIDAKTMQESLLNSPGLRAG